MDLRTLEYFVQTVESGSFNKAAEVCFVSQAAISKQIGNLEASLEISLYDRSGYRPVLTKAGEMFYKEAKRIIKSYRDAVKMVRELEHVVKPKLTIGISGPMERKSLPGILRTFRPKGEEIEINIVEGSFSFLPLALRKKSVDAIFGLGDLLATYDFLEYHPLFQSKICVIVSADHPWHDRETVTGKELEGQRLIVHSRRFSDALYERVIESCRADGYEPNIAIEVSTFDEMFLIVSSGDGIGIVSEEVMHASQDVHQIKLIETHHTSQFGIAKLKDNTDPLVDQFIQTVEKYFL